MKPLLTVAQVATALGVHRSVAYREVKAHMVHVVVASTRASADSSWSPGRTSGATSPLPAGAPASRG